MEGIGYILALLVGVSLGLIGSGGSILTVPILVYVMGIEPVLATAYSLFIVGGTSLVGGIQSALLKRVDFKTVLIFGIPSIGSVYLTRAFLLPAIPDEVLLFNEVRLTKSVALMLLFAIVMILAAFSMIRKKKGNDIHVAKRIKFNYPIIFMEGSFVGLLTGLVGAGGGFLIIPALVILAKMPMKMAVGTSLFIIAAKSLLGFLGDVKVQTVIDWKLLLIFTMTAIIGIFAGGYLTSKIEGEGLKRGFGWFVLVMGGYIIFKELIL